MRQPSLFGETATRNGARDCWATPRSLFAALDAEFVFVRDLAAEAWSTKVPGAYFTREDDALTRDWHTAGGWQFLNPPFSEIPAWVGKARREAELGARIVMVLPAHRCEQPWFHEHVIGHAREVRMIRRRVNYIPPPGIKSSGAEFASMVVVYDRTPAAGVNTQLRGQG